MTLPITLFLLAVVLPVFFGRIRSAPVWLALQAAALAWAGLAQHAPLSLHGVAALVEVIVLRVALAPWLLRRAIRVRGEPDRELMPSNLFTWAVAIALVVLAFEFGAPAADPRHAMTLGAVAATVAVALLLLATNGSSPAQLVAVLTMENALALFESLLPEPWPWPVHLALVGVYVGTVAVGGWLIATPDEAQLAIAEPEGERA